ncbi:membrane or secreted protein [Verrucomicrobia bacterium S94]|nr:membrane or secreted protein [Verrucomicrobia bacterium S94]
MRLYGFFLLWLSVCAGTAVPASTYVDHQGVMRWTETQEEVCVFGVNYAPPFAYWEMRQPIGYDQHRAIDEDVYHIARLGIDGYRVHVWPSYISDEEGKLIYNEHFELFDYLLFRLKERGIKLFITPMYLSGTHGGFPKKFGGKIGCLSNPEAFPVQENYLARFVAHVNPYTGVAYQDDPDILGFEIVNEPAHWKRPDLTEEYIDRMVEAIRSAGCEKPLFYNMTTSAAQIDEILKGKINGGTFQWYPTGLTSNHDLKGNLLPNVDRYVIPFADRLEGLAKFVYEFSPADVGASSHLYPAMARSFREAGFQFAAQFAYDPMHAAYCNVAYRTHFLNLAYTPKKAIGMLIASEAFHAVPRNRSYGRYPQNNRFEAFRLSYPDDLAELVTDKKFLYSNDTETEPPKPELLEKVAGTGCSPVVEYDGTGAYFFDKLSDGVWRMEIMPDAVWLEDPFFVPYIQREVAVTVWNERTVKLSLPDLGGRFSVCGLNEGNTMLKTVENGTFSVEPGSYLLVGNGVTTDWDADDRWQNIRLGEFHAPQQRQVQSTVLHTPPVTTEAGTALPISARVITAKPPEAVELLMYEVGRSAHRFPMQKIRGFEYEVKLPADLLKNPGVLRYYICVKEGENWQTFPSGTVGGFPMERRIYQGDRRIDKASYTLRVVGKDSPVCLFDAERDWHEMTKAHRQHRFDLYPAPVPGKSLIKLNVQGKKSEEQDLSVRMYCRPHLRNRLKSLGFQETLALYGRALNDRPCTVQLALLMEDGSCYGATMTVFPECGTYRLPLSDLKPVKTVLLPRAYPSFQRYWFELEKSPGLDLAKVESIQLSIRPGPEEKALSSGSGVAVGWITVE